MATEKLSAQQRSKIRRLSQPKEHSPDEAGGELNIVPFLDIIMNVLIFVLATITVTRVGGSRGSVSVRFATSSGTASGGIDYSSTSGTLAFASGETSKTFTVRLRADTLAEADEFLNLTLSNPAGGATLGTPSTATLTIIDND